MKINKENIKSACNVIQGRKPPKIIGLVNDQEYDDIYNYFQSPLEDLFYLSIFGLDFVQLDDLFCCPGNKEKGKWILWDRGYPLDKLNDIINNADKSLPELIESVTTIVDLVEKACKGKKVE